MSHQHFRLCCWTLGFKLNPAEASEDIARVFSEFSENGIMSVENLLRFLREFQKEADATRETAQEIIDSVKRLNLFHHRGLVIDEFFRYLLMPDRNNALNTKVKNMDPFTIHHDMNEPLAHYFIFTGHNSYLTGNQLSSKSSVAPIIKALKKGVRVIELDLWPNSRKNDIDVRHGGTLTSSVKLIKCLRAIKSYAFHASKYPLIITFEDHLTEDLQAKVAVKVKRTFEDTLFCPGSEMDEFPSPEFLQGKILISTKTPKKYTESGSAHEQHSENEIISFKDEASSTQGARDLQEHQEQDEDVEEEASDVTAYKDLIAIRAGKLKGSIKYLPTRDHNVTRLSMSEETLELATKKHGKEIIQFTQRNLLRVFPKGTRITSTNYDPFVGWMHGAQLVAFNMQGYGKYLWVMQGMFRANGGCGYVKKPDFLLDDGNYDEVFDPLSLPVKKTLKVYIYMGEGWRQDFHFRHFDYCSPPDFYTKLSIIGVPSDSTESERTETINNQWVPSWNGQEFDFPLRVPELALLRIEVKDQDMTGENEFAGQACLPVSELKTGFRCVPLYDKRGDIYRSVRLLMGFEFS